MCVAVIAFGIVLFLYVCVCVYVWRKGNGKERRGWFLNFSWGCPLFIPAKSTDSRNTSIDYCALNREPRHGEATPVNWPPPSQTFFRFLFLCHPRWPSMSESKVQRILLVPCGLTYIRTFIHFSILFPTGWVLSQLTHTNQIVSFWAWCKHIATTHAHHLPLASNFYSRLTYTYKQSHQGRHKNINRKDEKEQNKLNTL